MNLLALDMATSTGWCCGYMDKGNPVLGTIKLPSTGKNLGKWGNYAFMEYTRIVNLTHPDRILYESPFLGGKTQLVTLRKLYTLATVIEEVASGLVYHEGVDELVRIRDEIPVSEVAITTVKKTLTGSGRAKKPEMVAAARSMGMEPKSDDEADAFGIWLHGCKHFYPDAAQRFFKRSQI